MIDAWKVLANGVNAAFPDKLLADEIISNVDAFPLINNQGQIVTEESPTYVDVTTQIIQAGLAMFPGRFAVQPDGLNSVMLDSGVLDAETAGAIEGWQTNTFLNSGNSTTTPVARGATCP